MALLTKPEQLKGNSIIKGLIYGQPGIGKSTLALSAPNPVCIDFDKGMNRVDPQHRVPSLQVNTYAEVLTLLGSGELDSFDTIVVDTLGKLVDRIGDHVAKGNPKARRGNGQLTMQGWGEVKGVFQSLFKMLESMNKSIIFVAHESEEKNGDETIKRPECSGSARKDVVKELDFMGYMEVVGGKRIINFTPSDKFYAKNSLRLEGNIIVPDTANGNTFIATEVIGLNKKRLDEQADLQGQYTTLIDIIDTNIQDLQSVDDVNAYYSEMNKKEVIWDSSHYEKNRLNEHIQELGIKFNRKQRVFEAVEDDTVNGAAGDDKIENKTSEKADDVNNANAA